ncbi:hypothetical protein [Amycolatopsis nigrescens]|nr:hypothetical protein [Amycolatopsis nigrescens]
MADRNDVPRPAGPFRWRLARSRIDRLFTSASAAGAFAELVAGTA